MPATPKNRTVQKKLSQLLKSQSAKAIWAVISLTGGVKRAKKSLAGNTPLHFATENNNLQLLKLLAKYERDINAKNIYGWSVLHSAASGLIKTAGGDENWEIIKWLLEKGVKSGVETKSGLEIKDVLAEIGSSYVKKYEKLLNDTKVSCLIQHSPK